MILLLAGTSEGRKLAEELLRHGFELIVSTVTSYGGSLLPKAEKGLKVLSGELHQEDLQRLIADSQIQAVVDATHPYAESITASASSAARRAGKRYIRWLRDYSSINWEHRLIYQADSLYNAAKQAAALGQNILLTTGSRGLREITSFSFLNDKRMVARVLSVPDSVQNCLDCGIAIKNIIALQGPCSKELNKAIYRDYGIDVIISKESGPAGGTDAKVAAALELDLPIVIIKRPDENAEEQVRQIDDLVWLLKGGG